MAFGKTELSRASGGGAAGRSSGAAGSSASASAAMSEEARLHAAISTEIDERRDFLQSMRAAGKGKEHEANIGGQIAERMEELAKLERLMADELKISHPS